MVWSEGNISLINPVRCTITHPYNNSQRFLFSTGTITVIHQTNHKNSFPISKMVFGKFSNFWCMTSIYLHAALLNQVQKVSQLFSNTSFFFSVIYVLYFKSGVFSLSMDWNTSFDVLDGVIEGLYKVRLWQWIWRASLITEMSYSGTIFEIHTPTHSI